MDAQQAREKAWAWANESDRIRRQADEAGELATVYDWIACGGTAKELAAHRAGIDLGLHSIDDLPYAEETAAQIWQAIDTGSEQTAGRLAYALRAHYRKLTASALANL